MSITYAIRERYKQRREPLSTEEALESWNVAMNRTYKTVRLMTGVLALTLDGRIWPRPKWEDKAGRPLESQVEAIVDGLEKVARDAEARDAERRESERLYQEERRREEAARQAVLAEEARWRRFLEMADAMDQARQARALLAAMEAELSEQEVGDGAHEFLKWALARLDRFDPLAQGAAGIMFAIDATKTRED